MKRRFSALQPNSNEGAEGASTSNVDSTSSEFTNNSNQDMEPATKQMKPNSELAENLTQFLNCVVCLDLPSAAIYQCRNGHIMCECCYERLLAESIMRKQRTRCPLCRVFIPKRKSVRCLCAERVATLLPVQCAQCNQTLLKAHLEEHENSLCPARPVQCKYKTIGCTWSGPFAALHEHEQQCTLSKQPLKCLLPNILTLQAEAQASNAILERLMESFTDGRFFLEDLCTANHDYNNFTHMIHYSTNKFRAFDLDWLISIKFAHPEYASADTGGGYYQVHLKTRPDRHINAKFFLLANGSTGVNLPLQIHEYDFSFHSLESNFKTISLPSSTETYRLLAKLKIHFRFVMIVAP